MKTPTQDYIDMEEAAQRKPVEIYHMWRPNGSTHWYYTSGDSPITYGGNLYIPATIERDAVSYNANLEVSSMNVQAAAITEPATHYLALNPIETIWLDVKKLFRDQDPYEAAVVFVGQIKSVAFKGGEAQAEVVGFEYFLKQQLPIFRYQPQCNNFLFDDLCGLNAASWAVSANVTQVSGSILTCSAVSGYADGYFSLGHLKWGDYWRHITTHVGSNLTMRYFLPEIAAGQTITVYPGCNLDISTCKDKFDNVLNFFGHPYIPIKNPAMGI